MDVKTAIHTRRSVRKYKSTPVPKELVLELLEAANLAPSATNRQPWEFVVVHRSYLERLEDILKEAFRERVAGVSEEVMRRAIKDLSLPEDASGDRLKGLGTFYRTLGGAPIAIGVCLPREKDPWVWKNNHQRRCRRHRKPAAGRLGQGVGHVLDDRAAERPGRRDRRLPGGPAGPGARGDCYAGVPGSPARHAAQEGYRPENQMDRV